MLRIFNSNPQLALDCAQFVSEASVFELQAIASAGCHEGLAGVVAAPPWLKSRRCERVPKFVGLLPVSLLAVIVHP